MQPNPISIVIRNNKTRQFQETSGILYISQKGGKTHYTAILEKENVDIAAPQKFIDNMSPLQWMLERQDKSRQKAESIADKIIEEIILQKSKKSMAEKLIREQNQELRKLADDISMHNGLTDSRCLNTPINGNGILHKQPSTQSIDFTKRSNSILYRQLNGGNNPNLAQQMMNSNSSNNANQQYFFSNNSMLQSQQNNQNFNSLLQSQIQLAATPTLPAMPSLNQQQSSQMQQVNNSKNSSSTPEGQNSSSIQQKKNELIMNIGNQIERNIKEQQLDMGMSLDNASENNMLNRFSPRSGSPQFQELRSITKSSKNLAPIRSPISLIKCGDSVTEEHNTDNNPSSRGDKLNNPSPLDLKELLKKAIMNKSQSPSGQNEAISQNQQMLSTGFSQAKQRQQPSYLTSFGHLEEQQENELQMQITTKETKESSQTRETQQSYGDQQNEETLPTGLLKRKHVYSQSQGGHYLDSFNVAVQQQQQQQQQQYHLSTQESRFSQFKTTTAEKQKSQESQNQQVNYHQKTISEVFPSNKTKNQVAGVGGGEGSGIQQVSDFVSAINKMLSKSASINLIVEKSMQESEKNLSARRTRNMAGKMSLQDNAIHLRVSGQ